jgi:hypothetical protein
MRELDRSFGCDLRNTGKARNYECVMIGSSCRDSILGSEAMQLWLFPPSVSALQADVSVGRRCDACHSLS